MGSLTLSLDDLDPLVSDFSKDHWIASSDLCIDQCIKPPIGVSLLYFLSPEHPFRGLFSTIEDFISLSDEITRRFEWIWIEGQTSLMSSVLESLESNGYEVKIWREDPLQGPNFRKAPEKCGALLQKSRQEDDSPLSVINHTKGHLDRFAIRGEGHIDPIKLKRLFGSDPFTRSEQWHTRDLFEEEQERQLLLEAQKPKRHDPLEIFDSEEAPVVVKMSNPFAPPSNPSLLTTNRDPLGIFSSGEKPVVVKMNLNLHRAS